MLVVFILFVVVVVCTLVQIAFKELTDTYWFLDMITGIFGMFSAIALIACLFIIPWNVHVKDTVDKYNHYLELYNSGKNNDAIQEEINKLNNSILSNRVYKDNVWVGVFYSEDIANLKIIK